MSDEPYEMHVRITGELRPPCIIALETAVEMCQEDGWTVETVVAHRTGPKGLAMWRIEAPRAGEGHE